MTIFGTCGSCNKRRLHVAHRSFVNPKVGKAPITSKSKLCGSCFLKIKKATL